MNEDMTTGQAYAVLKEFILGACERRMSFDECKTAIKALATLKLKAEDQDDFMKLLKKREVTFGRRKNR